MTLELREKLGEGGVLELALNLHMAYTGSMECMPENIKELLEISDYILDNWEESIPCTVQFDEAVRNLLWIAREEGRKELSKYGDV